MVNLTNIKSVNVEGNRIELITNKNNQPAIRRSRLLTAGPKKGEFKVIEAVYFSSEEKRNDYVIKMVKSFVAEKNAKAAKEALIKETREKMDHPFKVGMVLYSSWGYEQTNIDFYQITEIKGKQIVIKEISGNLVEYTSHDSGRTVPMIDSFKSEGIKKNIQFSVYNEKVSYYIKMDGARGQLSIYDNGEKGCYCSWGY